MSSSPSLRSAQGSLGVRACAAPPALPSGAAAAAAAGLGATDAAPCGIGQPALPGLVAPAGPRAVHVPEPFVPAYSPSRATSLSRRESVLAAWRMPGVGANGARPLLVRAFLRALKTALEDSACWHHTAFWLGGSAAVWRMGALWQWRSPQDLDPIVFVSRAQSMQDASITALQSDVTTLVRTLSDARVHSRIQQSASGTDAMLIVTLGDGEDHLDLRFVFADEAFAPYDFACNALVCGAFDSAIWSVLPGPDAARVMHDVDQGIYATDHALRHTGVVRAAKVRALGLVPATPAQDDVLWHALATFLHTGGDGDPLGPALRLNTVFSHPVSEAFVHPGSAMRGFGILGNALLSLGTQTALVGQGAMYTQLWVSLARLVPLCPTHAQPEAQAICALLKSPALGPAMAMGWQVLAAATPPPDNGATACQKTQPRDAPDARWPFEMPRHHGCGHVRFCAGPLQSFWLAPLRAPEAYADVAPIDVRAAWPKPDAAPGITGPQGPLGTPEGLAWLLVAEPLAALIPKALWATDDRQGQVALRLTQAARTCAQVAPHYAVRLGLAARALSPGAPLPELLSDAVGALDVTCLTGPVIWARHLYVAQHTLNTLAREGDSAAGAHAWASLGRAALFVRRWGAAGVDASGPDDAPTQHFSIAPRARAIWAALCAKVIGVAAQGAFAQTPPAHHARVQNVLSDLLASAANADTASSAAHVAACVQLRAQLPDGTTGLSKALRQTVHVARRAAQSNDRQGPEHAVNLAAMLHLPQRILALAGAEAALARVLLQAQILALVRAAPDVLEADTALAIAQHVPLQGWAWRRAVNTALRALGHHPRTARRLCHNQARLQALWREPVVRQALLCAVEAAGLKDAHVLAGLVHAALAHPKASARIAAVLCTLASPQTQTGVIVQALRQTTCSHALWAGWQAILRLHAARPGPPEDGFVCKDVFVAVCQHHACLPIVPTATPSPNAPRPGQVRTWQALVDKRNALPLDAAVGLACLWLVAGRPARCFEVLTPLCAEALAGGPHSSRILHVVEAACDAAAHAALPQNHEALRALGHAVLASPTLHRRHIGHVSQLIRALGYALSQHCLHRLAGDVMVHAFATWHQRAIGDGFAGNALTDAPAARMWAQTLLRNLEDAHKALLFVPLVDRTIAATMDHWCDSFGASATPPGSADEAVAQAVLRASRAALRRDFVWPLILARGRLLCVRPNDSLTPALQMAMQHPVFAAEAAEDMALWSRPVDLDDAQAFVGPFFAWLQTAPDAAAHKGRAAHVYSAFGLDDARALCEQMPLEACAYYRLGDALAALMPALIGGFDAPAEQTATWTKLFACLIVRRPKLAWINAAFACPIDTPERVQRRGEMHMLLRLKAMPDEADKAVVRSELAIAIVQYAMALANVQVDVRLGAKLINEVLRVMGLGMRHPHLHWAHELGVFYDTSPADARARMPAFAALRAALVSHEATRDQVPQSNALQRFSEESLSYFLHAQDQRQLTYGFVFLGTTCDARLGSWPASDPWRLALRFGLRDATWFLPRLSNCKTCDIHNVHPQVGHLLAALVDSLWDANQLSPGVFNDVATAITRLWGNRRIRQGLNSAMQRLCRYVKHTRIDDAPSLAAAARQNETRYRLDAAGQTMLQSLVDALAFSDAKALSAKAAVDIGV